MLHTTWESCWPKAKIYLCGEILKVMLLSSCYSITNHSASLTLFLDQIIWYKLATSLTYTRDPFNPPPEVKCNFIRPQIQPNTYIQPNMTYIQPYVYTQPYLSYIRYHTYIWPTKLFWAVLHYLIRLAPLLCHILYLCDFPNTLLRWLGGFWNILYHHTISNPLSEYFWAFLVLDQVTQLPQWLCLLIYKRWCYSF